MRNKEYECKETPMPDKQWFFIAIVIIPICLLNLLLPSNTILDSIITGMLIGLVVSSRK